MRVVVYELTFGTQETVSSAARGSAYRGAVEACVRGPGPPPMTRREPTAPSREHEASTFFATNTTAMALPGHVRMNSFRRRASTTKEAIGKKSGESSWSIAPGPNVCSFKRTL